MNPWNTGVQDKVSVFEGFAEVVKATANGRRLELMELLAQGEHSVEDLARMVGMSVTSASAHLQTLSRTGLVTKRRERTTIFYRLSGDDVAELYTAAKRVALNRSPRLRETLDGYMSQPVALAPGIDRAAVTPEMFIVDVRPVEEYEAGHFVGANSFPLAELVDRIGELPTDAEIVVYCRGELCRMAREAVVVMREHGLAAKAMVEGVVEWRASKEIELDAS